MRERFETIHAIDLRNDAIDVDGEWSKEHLLFFVY
jgi:hypothetical protein